MEPGCIFEGCKEPVAPGEVCCARHAREPAALRPFPKGALTAVSLVLSLLALFACANGVPAIGGWLGYQKRLALSGIASLLAMLYAVRGVRAETLLRKALSALAVILAASALAFTVFCIFSALAMQSLPRILH